MTLFRVKQCQFSNNKKNALDIATNVSTDTGNRLSIKDDLEDKSIRFPNKSRNPLVDNP